MNTQFTVQPELVGTYQIVMKLVGRCGAEAQLGIEQIFPLHLFTVIIVGKQLQVGKHGVSALTSLVPVVGDIVLGNLQRTVSTRHPPVGLVDNHVGFLLHSHHILLRKQFHDGRLGRNLLLYIILEYLPFHHLLLGHYNQIGTIHIRVQQRTVHQFVGSVL